MARFPLTSVTLEATIGSDYEIDFTPNCHFVKEGIWGKRFRLSDGSSGQACIELHHNNFVP